MKMNVFSYWTRWLRLTVIGLLLSPLVFAFQDREFRWTPPTQNEDGSPLPDSEIKAYNIYCNGSLLGVVENTGGVTSWRSPDGAFPPGTYTCHATTVATNDEESAQSNSVNFTVGPLLPEPPSGFSVGP